MIWLPRTLLWRAFLLIAVLMVASVATWFALFRQAEREPRAQQIAQVVISAVNLTRTALLTAHPDKRKLLLEELSGREGIRVYPAEPGEHVLPIPENRPIMRLIAAEVRRQLGDDTRIALERDGLRGFWVSFHLEEEEDRYWVMLPRERVEYPDRWRWLGWGALALALALGGAYLIVSRINHPLRELSRAAALVGEGRTPPRLAEAGAAEIATLARAFNQMSQGLEELNRERALVLAGISHDLRSPLARLRLGAELSEADVELRQGMVADIEQMDAVIGQFLDFAREGEGEDWAAEADLNALAKEVWESVRHSGRIAELDLGCLPPMTLKPLAVKRLLANLLENAFRHGGGAVVLATASEGGRAVLRVLDRGPGLPDTARAAMLRPFARLDTARGSAGTGLGLAIVERVVRLHGGTVELLARNGGGLEARVTLPIRPAAAALRPSPSS